MTLPTKYRYLYLYTTMRNDWILYCHLGGVHLETIKSSCLRTQQKEAQKEIKAQYSDPRQIHTHTHIHKYIYMHMCVCMCVHICGELSLQLTIFYFNLSSEILNLYYSHVYIFNSYIIILNSEQALVLDSKVPIFKNLLFICSKHFLKQCLKSIKAVLSH